MNPLSLSIYIYIFFILVDVWFFRLISFYVLIYFYYLFNFILFIYYMSSFEIIEWFTIILLHSMTWIIWYLELYTFLLNILLLILFYIILLFVSHSLPKKVIALSLSLSQLLILSCNCKFRLMNFFCVSTFGWYTLVVCFLSYLSHALSIL